MADLVEYCWGNTTTTWGKMRVADGHPEPYRLKYIELGNEQYNHLFVAQVTAMEERATAIGIPKTLHYIFPDNPYLKPTDLAAAEKLGLGDHLITDLHVGATG
jgi:alpha-L-arabinofuranosidase